MKEGTLSIATDRA